MLARHSQDDSLPPPPPPVGTRRACRPSSHSPPQSRLSADLIRCPHLVCPIIPCLPASLPLCLSASLPPLPASLLPPSLPPKKESFAAECVGTAGRAGQGRAGLRAADSHAFHTHSAARCWLAAAAYFRRGGQGRGRAEAQRRRAVCAGFACVVAWLRGRQPAQPTLTRPAPNPDPCLNYKAGARWTTLTAAISSYRQRRERGHPSIHPSAITACVRALLPLPARRHTLCTCQHALGHYIISA